MPIRYPEILGETANGAVRSWNAQDSILYALGLGIGADPLDASELPFVYEQGQKVVPTLAAVLTRGLGISVAQMGIDYRLSVHGEQAITWHRPLGTAGSVVGEGRVVGVYDKGDKGAVVIVETRLVDAGSGEPVATVRVTSFARGDSNCGAPATGAPSPHPIPERAADLTLVFATRPDLALLYRLTGDSNPLHADPVAARAAGFPRPILHGLCTYGIACRAILAAHADNEPDRLASLAVRFSAPVYPGDEIAIDMWRDGNVIAFEARVPARGVTVLKNGRAELRRGA